MSAGRRALLQAVSLGVLVAAWEVAARTGWVDSLFVPAPSAVVRALRVIGPEAVGLLGETLGKTLVAYALAVALGVGAGLLIGGVR
jgi:ABC-type nitrate/sulfonate/bicarbonate transport system permease component